MKKKPEVTNLYYITHIENLPSILRHGILSHAEVERRSLNRVAIYDASIVNRRRERRAPDGRTLWEFANVYFQPRNPMLYRVLHERPFTEMAILGVRRSVLDAPGVLLADGNAANDETRLLEGPVGSLAIQEIWGSIRSEWWNSVDGSKRRIMAECLVPDRIAPESLDSVYVTDHATAERVRLLIGDAVPIVPEPHMFFRPTQRHRIAPHLSLVEGDMFFSAMQTLTVSVNTVGVMGRGLASRAKHQFPDVYVFYQEACRAKSLAMGRPVLYKRESFVDVELADDPVSLHQPNARKWFLLFPTKSHWRNASDIDAIGAGLRWLTTQYRALGIQSLALPALGCGLGQLDWKDIGPLMCQELARMDITVVIYLPREREIPLEHLSPRYLTGHDFVREPELVYEA